MSLQYGGECSCEDTASCLCSMEVSAPWSVSHACSRASHSCGGTWRNAADFNTDVHHHGRDTVDTHWSLHDREYALEPLTVHLVKLANHDLSCTDMVFQSLSLDIQSTLGHRKCPWHFVWSFQ